MKLTFDDGEVFDLSGPLHLETREDGCYVVGHGLLMAVDSEEEGKCWIRDHQRYYKTDDQLNMTGDDV